MSALIVYTAITGDIPDVLAPIRVQSDRKKRPVRYVCFSDRPRRCPDGWELHQIRYRHHDSRMTARWHKVMSHALFENTEFTLWHDGSHALTVNPWEVVDTGLSMAAMIATFKHPQRNCVYEEASACIRLKKDAPERLIDQARRYWNEGYPRNGGLYETSCVARRTSKLVLKLNEAWWSEILGGSCRDQVSLPYSLWKTGVPQVGLLPGCREYGPYFDFRWHKDRGSRKVDPTEQHWTPSKCASA
jgi:Protein of unknown function (DUF616)